MMKKIPFLFLFLLLSFSSYSKGAEGFQIIHLKEGESIKTKDGLEITFRGGGHTFGAKKHKLFVRFMFRYQGKESVQEVLLRNEQSKETREIFGFEWKILETASGFDPKEIAIQLVKKNNSSS